MDDKNRYEENYDYIYEDYMGTNWEDVEDMIFAVIKEEREQSEK